MLKKQLIILLLLCTITFVLLACSSSRNANTSTESISANQVHMSEDDFDQKTITIKKGESITLISDTHRVHIIANGSWENYTPKQAKEPGAPEINDMQIAGYSSGTIGPFNTVGTYKIYCTIHVGMKMTILVQ